MKKTVRFRLMGYYLLLVLLLGAALYAYLAFTLERDLVSSIRGHLEDEARMAALMAAKEIRDPHRDAPVLTRSVARAIRARVTLILPSGEVTGDSEVTAADLPKLENHADRPEVKQARQSGIGSSIRYSATLHTDMMYLAVPFGAGDGFVRLALPLSQVEKTKLGLQKSLAAAFAVVILLSLFLSYLLSHLSSRPLRDMAAAAIRIGRGDLGARVPVRSLDELGELAAVLNDMARRIEGQMERISSEKNRLDAILEGMGEGVMVTDADAVLTLVNPAFCRLFRVAPSVQGRQLLEISRRPDLNDTCRRVIAERRELHQELTLSEGSSVKVHWVPLLQNGALGGVVAVFHDVSGEKRVDQMRRDFVANVSHELRTPVTVIRGYAETLISGTLAGDPERTKRFLEIINNHAQRLSRLIADLLALSELESGVIVMHPENVSLEAAVQQTLQLLELKSEEKGVTMESRGLKGLPEVRADRGRLDQVLLNLLDNALKYSKNGGTVTVSGQVEGEMVRVLVRDTGVGIPEQELPRLFERFYRVDEARSRELGGTGLGLSIVKHIVQAHGGSVAVKSVPGEGAEFSFTLPKA